MNPVVELSPASLGLLIAGLLTIGTFGGFLAGLLGIGGGMIMVPFIKVALLQVGFPSAYAIKVAIATSLCTIVFTSFSSLRTHNANGAVLWPVVLRLSPGIVIGALAGAQIAAGLRTAWLTAFFGLFLGFMGLNTLRKAHRGRKNTRAHVVPKQPATAEFLAVGGLIGSLSAVLGAGGGFLTVPYLERRGYRLQQAVGCSAACGFPIAVAGALGYIVAGWNLHIAPGTIGYIHWPGLLVISLASVIAAHFGATTSHRIGTDKLRWVMGGMLFSMAAYMLWSAFRSGG
jgi:uncharacterized membrane protein YfcA